MSMTSDATPMHNVVNMTLGHALATVGASGMRVHLAGSRIYLTDDTREIYFVLYRAPGTAMEVVVEGWEKTLNPFTKPAATA